MKFNFLVCCVTLLWILNECHTVTVEPEDEHSPELRIVGGKIARIDDYPYMAQINMLEIRICGGSILAWNWILTAGHCTYRGTANELSVRVGTPYNAKDGVLIGVKQKAEHPMYNDKNLDYDVAVLRLFRNIPQGRTAKPIPLAGKNDFVRPGTMAVVTGWGLTDELSYEDSYYLRSVVVPVISDSQCQEWYSRETIHGFVICAGYSEGKKDACVSDSGGPLVAKGKQIGIVSWGVGCARAKRPGVYTEVAYPEIRSFIQKKVGL